MLALIVKESEELRTVRFDAEEVEAPTDKPFTYTHLFPVEVQRLREATLDEVQTILKRFI